jgi:threonine dehydratase
MPAARHQTATPTAQINQLYSHFHPPSRSLAMFTLDDLRAAADVVHETVSPTPLYDWPLIAERAGCKVWVKHENHTPIGAFKVRGGLVYVDELAKSGERPDGLISATRGNHGQSIAMAGARAGLPVTLLIPLGNSPAKNRAMRAFGADLIEHGVDFDEAKLEADRLAKERNLHFVTAFHPWLVKGVATYALELFEAHPNLDTVYAPIGMGSGICGLIAARDLLGLETEIVGVVADQAPAVALSFVSGVPVPTNSAQTFADGLACRDPHLDAVTRIHKGASRVVRVSEDDIAAAIRAYYDDTHNLAEGAGAASLAALLQDRERRQGGEVAVILSGGNIDEAMLQQVLAGQTPQP